MNTMIINQQNQVNYNQHLQNVILKVVKTVAQISHLPQNSEVSILLVDDSYIKELNFMYRGQNIPTDVLSFAMNEVVEGEPEFDFSGESNVLGDIVISLPKTLAQSQEYGHSLERELGFLVAHGMLHLLGYDHETKEEEEAMQELQDRIMQIAKLER